MNFKDRDYSFEGELFYKKIQNRIDYIDGADILANNEIEQVILNGKARAYGCLLYTSDAADDQINVEM